MTTLRLSSTPLAATKADAIVIGVALGPKGKPVPAAGAEALDQALKGKLAALLADLGATGKPEDVVRFGTLGAAFAPVVLAVGVGDLPAKGKAYDAERLRRASGAAIRALAGSGTVLVSLPTSDAATFAAVAEGALFGAYSFDDFRHSSLEGRKAAVKTVLLAVPDTLRSAGANAKAAGTAAKATIKRADALAKGVSLVRDLVNTPPGDLPPARLADRAVLVAESAGLTVEVLDEKKLAKGGYGGILGVGQGSSRPPRLVQISYQHPKATQTVALVGKGITFDSGGLSIKPAVSMETMKLDMAGAAAVLATVSTAAALGLRVNVTAWAPIAENMPSGSAIRPSDVLKMYGGKTVEVLNTDAEGRLILGDAIARASEDKPDYLIDVATLTGACVMALGTRTAGVMSNDDELRDRVVAAGDRAGESLWPLPLPADLRASLDSEVADLANMGERMGGALVAGLFLKEFVGESIRWAHLDIAGPSYNEGKPYGYTPTGGTGVAVRTLVTLLEEIAASG